jgi:hypothetical protein
MQLGTSVQRVETEAYYVASLILPDGQVVRVVERIEGGGGTSAGGSTGSSSTNVGSMSFTGGAASALTLASGNSMSFSSDTVFTLNLTQTTPANGGAANQQIVGFTPLTPQQINGVVNVPAGGSVTVNAGVPLTFTATGTITLSGATLVLRNALGGLGSGTLNISAATLDRLITVPGGVSAFYTGGGGSVPMQAVLFGPNGTRVYGLESYVTSEAGQAAIAALIAQGYTVPDPPGQP